MIMNDEFEEYFCLPENIILNANVPDSLCRLMAILYGLCDDNGKLIIKASMLSFFMGRGKRSILAIIKKGRDAGFFKTRQTGRGLEFSLFYEG